MNYNGNELVSYNSGKIQVGGSTGDYIQDFNNYYYHWVEPYYPLYFPTTPYITEKSKIEQGFKILSKMMENKIITKELTIKEFIKLVNDIAEIL
jgi:hypothetical protein